MAFVVSTPPGSSGAYLLTPDEHLWGSFPTRWCRTSPRPRAAWWIGGSTPSAPTSPTRRKPSSVTVTPSPSSSGARRSDHRPARIRMPAAAFADRAWRLVSTEVLGRGETPREGMPVLSLRLEYTREAPTSSRSVGRGASGSPAPSTASGGCGLPPRRARCASRPSGWRPGSPPGFAILHPTPRGGFTTPCLAWRPATLPAADWRSDQVGVSGGRGLLVLSSGRSARRLGLRARPGSLGTRVGRRLALRLARARAAPAAEDGCAGSSSASTPPPGQEKVIAEAGRAAEPPRGMTTLSAQHPRRDLRRRRARGGVRPRRGPAGHPRRPGPGRPGARGARPPAAGRAGGHARAGRRWNA